MPFFNFENAGGASFVGGIVDPVAPEDKGTGIPRQAWDSGDTVDLVKTLGGIAATIYAANQRGDLQSQLIQSNQSGVVQTDPRTGQTSVATGAGTLNSGSAGFFGTNSSGQPTLFGLPIAYVFLGLLALVILKR